MSVPLFLKSIGLECLRDLFEREKITIDILAEMTMDDLRDVGIDAYGIRQKLVRSIEKLTIGQPGEFVCLSHLI